MRKGPVLLLVLLASMLMPVSSQAMVGTEESPQAKAKVVEVDTLLESPAEYVGDVVSVSGTITRVKGNEFLLVANGESVAIDCGPPWYHTVKIEDGVEVTVTGQVGYVGPPWAERDRLEIEIDACKIAGASIRDCDFEGPPAWAGGPFRHFDMGPSWMQDGRVGPPWARNGGSAGPPWARAGISR